jgi:hypothetical protein
MQAGVASAGGVNYLLLLARILMVVFKKQALDSRGMHATVVSTDRNEDRNASSIYFFARSVGESFSHLVSGRRVFDFNYDGLANEGLLPDMFADLRRTGLAVPAGVVGSHTITAHYHGMDAAFSGGTCAETLTVKPWQIAAPMRDCAWGLHQSSIKTSPQEILFGRGNR